MVAQFKNMIHAHQKVANKEWNNRNGRGECFMSSKSPSTTDQDT